MSERPTKRLKQTSLAEFSFKNQCKPKLQSIHSVGSTVNNPIEISDSPTEEASPIQDSVIMADSGVGRGKDMGDEHGEKNIGHKNISYADATRSGIADNKGTIGSSSGGRKRPNTEMSPNQEKDQSNFAGHNEESCNKETQPTVDYNMSPELFTDSELSMETNSQEIEDFNEFPSPTTAEPLGTPLEELNRTPGCADRLSPLSVNDTHTVLFDMNYQFDCRNPTIPKPYPASYRDCWDSDHVRMPCSPENEYPMNNQIKRRWDLVEKALRGDLSTVKKLKEAILSYNSRYAWKWDFASLEQLLNWDFVSKEKEKFFKTTVKKMAHLALKLPHLCTQPIPLLKKGKTHSLTLSQQQISCLLANAFFCTFPRRNAHGKQSEYASYPDINFNSLFAGGSALRKCEKLKCIINYFNRVTDSVPYGTVTFTRQTLEQLPDWDESKTKLTKLHVASNGKIEDEGAGMLQVDFANKYVGGGVLGRGCVQEEIRFLICPEMIVSRLFTEVLDKNECLIMTGCERYSNYTGYADSFKWHSDYNDCTERDEWGRCRTEVVAIDAMVIRGYSSQFKAWCVKREMDKAYCGFYNPHSPRKHLPAVCTGNWGCGAFGGEKQLKALIQLMAAAEAGRDVCYFTFDDVTLQQDLFDMHSFLCQEQDLCVGDILKIIQQYYRKECQDSPIRPRMSLFQYIHKVFEYQDESSQETKSRWEEAEPAEKAKLEKNDSEDYKAHTP